MSIAATADETREPATLHGVMQAMIGQGLRRHYEAPKKLSHELFVLLLQLKEEEERKGRRIASVPKKRQRPSRPEPAEASTP